MEPSYIDMLTEDKSKRDSIEVLHGLVERLRLSKLNTFANDFETAIEGIDYLLQTLEMNNHKFYKQIFRKSKENLDRLASILEVEIEIKGKNWTRSERVIIEAINSGEYWDSTITYNMKNFEGLKRKFLSIIKEKKDKTIEEAPEKISEEISEVTGIMFSSRAHFSDLVIKYDKILARFLQLYHTILEAARVDSEGRIFKIFDELALEILQLQDEVISIPSFQIPRNVMQYTSSKVPKISFVPKYIWEIEIILTEEEKINNELFALWTIMESLNSIEGVSLTLESVREGSRIYKFKMLIKDFFAKEEVKEVLNKAKDSAMGALEKPAAETELLKKEANKLEAEEKKIEKETDQILTKEQRAEMFELKKEKLKAEIEEKQADTNLKKLQFLERLSDLQKEGLLRVDSIGININEVPFLVKEGGEIKVLNTLDSIDEQSKDKTTPTGSDYDIEDSK